MPARYRKEGSFEQHCHFLVQQQRDWERAMKNEDDDIWSRRKNRDSQEQRARRKKLERVKAYVEENFPDRYCPQCLVHRPKLSRWVADYEGKEIIAAYCIYCRYRDSGTPVGEALSFHIMELLDEYKVMFRFNGALQEVLRKKCKLSLSEMEKQSGISRQKIHNIEKGKSQWVDLTYAAAILEVFSHFGITFEGLPELRKLLQPAADAPKAPPA